MPNSTTPPASSPYQGDTKSSASLEDKRYAALKAALRDDNLFFFEEVLKIIPREGGKIVPFKPNRQQQTLLNLVTALKRCGLPVRIIILKARQMGFSTAVEGLAFQTVTQNPYHTAKVVAHKDDSTKRIFKMSRLFYEEMNPSLRPLIRYHSKNELNFENPDSKDRHKNPGLRSSLSVTTAGGEGVGRSETIQFAHLSEVAEWENDAEVATSFLQTVPYAAGTSIFLESTAKGAAGYFHDQYWTHKDGKEMLIKKIKEDWDDVDKLCEHLTNFRGTVGYIPLFFPWHEFPEYQIEFESGDELNWFRSTLTPYEREIKKEFKLTPQQLNWRRLKISELAKNAEGVQPEDYFRQEYPLSDREAFLESGSHFFDTRALRKMKPEPPKKRVSLLDGQPFEYTHPFNPPNFRENAYGELQIWETPNPGDQYAVGVDVSSGAGEDFGCIQVLNKRTLNQAAEWWGKVNPNILIRYAVQLASWYNEAIVAPENVGVGAAAVFPLMETNYPNPYIRNASSYKEIAEAPTNEWGFPMNIATKPLVMNHMAEHIRVGTVQLNSTGLIQECIEFIEDEKKRLTHPPGKHDDRVDAMAIALWVTKEHPYEDSTYLPIDSRLFDEKELEPMLVQEYAEDENYGDL